MQPAKWTVNSSLTLRPSARFWAKRRRCGSEGSRPQIRQGCEATNLRCASPRYRRASPIGSTLLSMPAGFAAARAIAAAEPREGRSRIRRHRTSARPLARFWRPSGGVLAGLRLQRRIGEAQGRPRAAGGPVSVFFAVTAVRAHWAASSGGIEARYLAHELIAQSG